MRQWHFLINKAKANERPSYVRLLCGFALIYRRAMRAHERGKLWHMSTSFGCSWTYVVRYSAALCKNAKHQVNFTDGSSEVFGGDTGAQQGCPLSPFLLLFLWR
jgi:hypothetical protein